jgi:hypothetical protein
VDGESIINIEGTLLVVVLICPLGTEEIIQLVFVPCKLEVFDVSLYKVTACV